MSRCFFISDLHLFANRSKAERYLDDFISTASRADHFVLGGDIFDFRWARTRSHDQTVNHAMQWLTQLIEACPACHFHFVLGNHDFHQTLIDRLEALEQIKKNFSWNRYYVRLGNSMFIHGDVADRDDHNAETLAAAREEWLSARRRGPFLSRLYDVVILTRIHKPVPHLVYAKRIVARRILSYLDQIGQGPNSGVQNVYFGHTHRHMINYPYGGIHFHNGGAPIKGTKFRILQAVVDD